MIDLHAHLLPGIDDGPPDERSAVELARAAVAAGIRAAAATPHIDYAHGVVVDELADRRAELGRALQAAGVALEILQGGELTGPRLMELPAEQLSALTLGGGRFLLLECPFTPAGSMFDTVVFRAQSLGFDVLLAHPERSPDFIGRLARLSALVDRRVLVQVTAGSLSGSFGRTVQRAAVEMLADGLVHVVASDAHDTGPRRPAILEGFAAAEPLLPGLAEHAAYWTDETPGAIVHGRDVQPPPDLRVRRTRLLARRLAPRRRAG